MTKMDKMIAGELYRAGDPELVAARKRAHSLRRRLQRHPATRRRGPAGRL